MFAEDIDTAALLLHVGTRDGDTVGVVFWTTTHDKRRSLKMKMLFIAVPYTEMNYCCVSTSGFLLQS